MRVAIFGLGYVGRHLAQVWRDRYRLSLYSRSSSLDGSAQIDVSQASEVRRLADRAVQRWDAVIVTLPAQDACPEFWDFIFDACPHVIVYGTTGIYERHAVHREALYETSPPESEHPRTAIEAELQTRGATVLRLAGIYGEGRNPRDWLSRGLVGADDRQVNFIHVSDIAAITQLVVERRPARRLYNLADGQPHSWLDIATVLHKAGYLAEIPGPKSSKLDSFVMNEQIHLAYPGLRFRDFWLALDNLCNPSQDKLWTPQG